MTDAGLDVHQPELSADGVRKAFGATAVLAGVDLRVTAGSLTAVLGPSGSGKTTLLRILAGFERADGGQVCIGGDCVDGPGRWLAPERRRVGYVPQEGLLFPHLSVSANVAFGLPRGRERATRVEQLLELVGLPGLGNRRPHELSGGQQQRVALARALAPRPRIVLLDEPFASLDRGLRQSLREDVRQVLKAEHTTAVLVTHDQDEALSIADVVAVLRAGRVVQAGTPRELYDSPADAEVAAFVGMANFVPGTMVDGDNADTPLGALCLDCPARIPAGARATILIRPEQLAIRPPERCPEGCPVAAVSRVDYHGHEAVVRLQLQSSGARPGTDLVARVPAGAAEAARPGDVVGVMVQGGVHVLAGSDEGSHDGDPTPNLNGQQAATLPADRGAGAGPAPRGNPTA